MTKTEHAPIAFAVAGQVLIESAADLICWQDAQGRIQQVSACVRTLLGYEPEDVLGRLAADFEHPDDLPRTRASLESARRTGQPTQFTHRVRHSSGEYLWLESTCRFFRGDAGDELQGMVCISRDVSARMQAELLLRVSHESALALGRAGAPDAACAEVLRILGSALGWDRCQLWLCDEPASAPRLAAEWTAPNAGSLREVRAEALAAKLGPASLHSESPPRAWFEGQSLRSLLARAPGASEDEWDQAGCLAFPLMAGCSRTGMLLLFRKQGLRPSLQEEQALAVLAEQVAQLLHRAAAHAALRVSEGRFRSLFEMSPLGIVLLDNGGRVLDLNPAAARMLGLDRAREQGLTVSDWTVLDAAPTMQLFRGYLERGTGRGEVTVRKGEGPRIALEYEIFGLPPALHCCVLRDVTELRHVEREARDRQADLMHASRVVLVGQLAAAMAHELNQPLSSIANFIDAGIRTLQRDPADEQRGVGYLREAQGLVQEASQIIRRTLSFADRDGVPEQIVSIEQVVEQALRLMQMDAHLSGVQLGSSIQAAGVLVRVDALQIKQVVCNLVRNAIESICASEAGARRIDVVVTRQGRRVGVSVTDSGPGIPREARRLLFDAFRSGREGGTGLGLWICLKIVEAHGGRIRLRRGAAGNTCFEFWLPICGVEDPASSAGES
jgi:two-component system sensor kinase FixL